MIKDFLMTLSKKSRFGLYMDLLQSSNYFKLVCGAGNEDKNEVEYLTYIYTLAGCSGFDVSASPEILKSAKKGIKASIIYLTQFSGFIWVPLAVTLTILLFGKGQGHRKRV